MGINEHLDRGDGEGESVLCFSCWALNNWQHDRFFDQAFFRAHDIVTDFDRREEVALREIAPDWSDPEVTHDARPYAHAAMVQARSDRRMRHPCFARRWFP